jgi:hypothetical protein
MFSTILIYTLIYLTLRRRSNPAQPVPHGATPLMILYPTIYTVCTIPIAAERIASMAGQPVTLAYFCVAGSMIACNGWLDVLLYSLTRRSIVFSEAPPGDGVGINTFWGMEKHVGFGTVTTIEGGLNPSSGARRPSRGGVVGLGTGKAVPYRSGRPSSSASTENLYAHAQAGSYGGIKVEATVHVRSEEDIEGQAIELRQQQRGRDLQHRKMVSASGHTSLENVDGSSWQTRSGSFEEL